MAETSAATQQPDENAGPAGRSALRFVDVTKEFPGVRALSDVSFDVAAGEVHALVGENGAGKSTLMAIGAGSLSADSGEVRIDGQLLDHAAPERARAMGLAIVYQEPALLPDLTVAENLALGTSKRLRPGWWSLGPWATESLATWSRNRKIDPTLAVRDLGPDVRFMVEISKALAQQPRVLILDEPTEHLATDDVAILFEQIRELTRAGTAVVYISHRIPEVQQISDRISVLRDGVHQGTFRVGEVTQTEIVDRIVGRSLATAFPPKRDVAAALGEPLLVTRGFSGGRFENLELTLHPGEIVGLAGVEGNGQHEAVRALAGMIPSRGDVTVDGRPVRRGSNVASAAAGLAYIPGDRHREGILPILGVRENISLASIGTVARAGVVSRRQERVAALEQVEALAIKTRSIETPVESLSGGNQQKVVLARVLESKPRVILADEPTQGVDVGARLEIYRFLREAVNSGSAALVVASDGAELEGLCDRVLVFSRGHVVREFTGDDVTEQNMTEAALTSTKSRDAPVAVRSETPLRRFLRGDYAPSAVVAAVVVGLCAYTATQNTFFLTGANFTIILGLFAALGLAGMAQQVAMMGGGIDLSVGPLMGFLVVIASFVIVPGRSSLLLLVGWLLLIAIAISVGVLNWLPTLAGVPPFLATLIMYTGLQGLSLLFRSVPGGTIDPGVTATVTSKIGWVPWAAIIVVAIGIALEVVLRRTTWGVQLRAVGSDSRHAHAVGVHVRRIQMMSYVGSALLAFLASLLLMAQIGSGDPSAGITYTLLGITAVVLGGASIFGGRGTFIGALIGAFLIQIINSSTEFLNVNLAWQTYLLGILILLAAGVYSKVRGTSVSG